MAQWERLQRLAESLDATVRRRFLDAVRAAKARADLRAIEQALADGNLTRAEQLLANVLRAEDLSPVASALRDLYDEAGRVTIQTLQVGRPLRFDVTNPLAVQWAEQNVGGLIAEITAAERLAVSEVIVRTVAGEQSVYDAARQLRAVIGLTGRQRLAVLNYRNRQMDLGASLRTANDRAIRYAAQKLAERAQTIARTETLTAVHAGQLAAWQQASANGGLRGFERVWIVTPDDKLCPLCEEMEDQRRGLDEPFVQPSTGKAVMIPTLHPRCRCAQGLVEITSNRRAA